MASSARPGTALWTGAVGDDAAAVEVDRGNQLGAGMASAERLGLTVTAIVEGPERQADALRAARETGVLLVPTLDRVVPQVADVLALLQDAGAHGWRLVLLDLGADTAAPSGPQHERWLRSLAALDADPAAAVPPIELRRRVSIGGPDLFVRSGQQHADVFLAALAEAGAPLDEPCALLEWGAGSGRMTAPLARALPHAAITAIDPDADAMRWLGAHLAVQALAIPVLPPVDLVEDAFALVIGHSVLSHLSPRSQRPWLAELARLTRPGGYVAVSVNGPDALRWHREHPLVDLPPRVTDDYEATGEGFWAGDGWDEEFDDGYHTMFVSPAFVRERWSEWFDVVAIHPGRAAPTQDLVVLRARG